MPRQIASNFAGVDREKIMDRFEKFYEYCGKTQKDGKFIATKNNVDCCEFILDLAYKLFLLEETAVENLQNPQNVFLDDHTCGISTALKEYNFCSTPEKALKYFDTCYDICDFIYHSLDNNVDIYDTYFMFKKEDGNKNVVWWYNILPLYLLKTYVKNNTARKYVYDYMCKMKAFQFTNKTVKHSTNVQTYITSMFKICKVIIKYADKEKELINTLQNEFKKEWIDKTARNELKVGINDFKMQFHKNDIERVLRWCEYIFITKLNANHDALYRYMVDKKYNVDLDHIIPKAKYNALMKSEQDVDVSPIGEMVLLESSLNRSKGDKMHKNSINYSNSGFYLTSFMVENTKKNLSKDKLNSIEFERYTEDRLNQFNEVDVVKRGNYIIDMYLDWIYDLSYNNNETHEEVKTIVAEPTYV